MVFTHSSYQVDKFRPGRSPPIRPIIAKDILKPIFPTHWVKKFLKRPSRLSSTATIHIFSPSNQNIFISMSFASSSRTLLARTNIPSIGSTRGVLHRARPPRMPVLPSPHNPKHPLPTSGTSHPVPPNLGTPSVLTTVTALPDSGLTFHHSPPPSAPNYTNGAVPDLFRWTAGESVRLSGEETAMALGERRWHGSKVGWSGELVQKMRDLRAQGLSRREIGESLQIPPEQQRLIPRVAPQSREQASAKLEEFTERRAKWGYRKRLAREVRQKRKEFW
ncbi:hypothetical protein C359_04686 [Cryptococcus neoformans Bt120]|nr:hypothetical protein C359_04686 [Cryptococcus neoformans var. grubii Bt120]